VVVLPEQTSPEVTGSRATGPEVTKVCACADCHRYSRLSENPVKKNGNEKKMEKKKLKNK
jgi:hypothetical protein